MIAVNTSREKGSTIVMALLVLSILAVLGVAFLAISFSESMHVINNEKKMQAYYIAKAGANAALQAWLDSPSSPKPEGSVSTLYLNSSDQFVTGPPTQRKVNIAISKQEDDSTVIRATGSVYGVAQTVTAVLGPLMYGHRLQPPWYNYTSGIIEKGEFSYDNTIVLDPMQNTLKLNASSGIDVSYSAPSIFFNADLGDPVMDDFYIHAGIIVFNGVVDVGNKGKLYLFVLPGYGVPVEGRTGLFGKVYFTRDVLFKSDPTIPLSGKAFYYKPNNPLLGVDIQYPNQGELIEMTGPVITPKPLDYGSIVWK